MIEPFGADRAATESRIIQLRRYMDAAVTDGRDFRCRSEEGCRSSLDPTLTFARGQLSYVGPRYDLIIGAKPYRVLVIAMDTGRTDELVTLEQRREQVFVRIPQKFSERNPHMRGTTSALRVLFGGLPGMDASGEWLDIGGESAHVFEAYAMANLRLCSAMQPGSTSSKGSIVMSSNCLRHLEASVRILEPTVVVLQGKALRKSLKPIVDEPLQLGPAVERVRLAGVPVVLASLSHPSYPGPAYGWAHLSAPYLANVVVPSLSQARTEALLGVS